MQEVRRYLGGLLIVQRTSSSFPTYSIQREYFLTDAQGSAYAVLDDLGMPINATSQQSFDAFGARRHATIGTTAQRLRTIGTTTFPALPGGEKSKIPTHRPAVWRVGLWASAHFRVRPAFGGGSGLMYSAINAVNARGQVTSESRLAGSVVQTQRAYPPGTGRLLEIDTGSGSLQRLTYRYDPVGSLSERRDLTNGADAYT